jgi:rhodanese-related sulfurtransferase
MIERGEPLVVLDVRETHERILTQIPLPTGVIDLHVPLGLLRENLERLREAAARGRLVVYCHHGVRSLVAAEWLAGMGVTGGCDLVGGIDLWSRTVDPGVARY